MQLNDDFFEAIGMADASPEDKQQLAQQVAEIVQTRIATRLDEVLNAEQADHFANLIDSGKEVEAFQYLADTYPEYGQIVQEEMDRARDELVADLKGAVARLDQVDATQPADEAATQAATPPQPEAASVPQPTSEPAAEPTTPVGPPHSPDPVPQPYPSLTPDPNANSDHHVSHDR